jgi:leader peptidase (prepilin peptidase)/N-methyltransferase
MIGLLYGLPGCLVGAAINVAADVLPGNVHTLQRSNARSFQRCNAVLLAVAGLFGLLGLRFGLSVRLVVVSLCAAILVLILVIDLEHRLVLNVVLAPAAGLALLASLIEGPGLKSAVFGGTVGFLLFLIIAVAYPGGLGMGDVKLAGLIGLMVGFPLVIVALIVGIVCGGVGVSLLFAARRVGRKSYVPYAPFLAVGGLVALVYGSEIAGWYLARLGLSL